MAPDRVGCILIIIWENFIHIACTEHGTEWRQKGSALLTLTSLGLRLVGFCLFIESFCSGPVDLHCICYFISPSMKGKGKIGEIIRLFSE